MARGKAQEAEAVRKSAIADFAKVIDHKPQDPQAWFGRGYVYVRLKRYADAVADLSKCLKLKADHSEAFHMRGHAQEGSRHLNEAIADHSRAIELAPTNLQMHVCRGGAYAHFDEWKKAAEDLARGLESPDADKVFLYQLALVRLKLGQQDDYQKTCARMFEHFGQSADADSTYWIIWTCVLGPDAVADWTKPLALAEEAHADDAKNYDTINNLGAALYRAGRLEEATKRLTEAEAAFQKTPSTRSAIIYNWFFQAMAHHRLGHTTDAAGWLKKAVEAIDEPKTAQDAASISWHRRLTVQLLRREAEELLKKESGVTKQEPEKKPN